MRLISYIKFKVTSCVTLTRVEFDMQHSVTADIMQIRSYQLTEYVDNDTCI